MFFLSTYNCHELTTRSALVTLSCAPQVLRHFVEVLQRIIIKYYRKKINEKLMGINGNSCHKTHYFLNTNLTIIGEFDNSGKMDEHKSIEQNESFICPYGQKSNKNLFYNLRLFEPEIFLSRQAPKIVLMIFHDFCSAGAKKTQILMFNSCVPTVAARTSMNILVLVFLVFTTAIVMMVGK